MDKTALWRPLDPANIRDPYPMYEQLRATNPIYLAQTGEYIITRYNDIKQILKSDSFASGNRLTWLKKGIRYFDNKEEDLRAIYQAMNSFILMLNGEQHLRIRNFVTRSWNNRQVDELISGNISRLLQQLTGKSAIDFVSEFAQPLPVHTISSILGIPVTDSRYLVDLGAAMTKTLDLYVSLKDLVQMNRAAAEFISFFREQIRVKSTHPDDALLSKLIQRNRTENIGLSEDELVSIGIFLFTAGEETSASLISNTMLHLLRHPQQLKLLRQDPELTESAIEEVLRYDSIVQLLGRVSKEQIALRDRVIPANATVTLVIGSANRDEEIFQEPNAFLITRKANRHLSFGSGVHYCLGDWLGRRQSQLAIRMFLERYPTIRLPEQELKWYQNIAIRRVAALNLELSR